MQQIGSRRVEIRSEGAAPWFCDGPNEVGDCPTVPQDGVVPCAGCALHVMSAPDDRWVFTVPATGRSCPLGWLERMTPLQPTRGVFSASPPTIWD